MSFKKYRARVVSDLYRLGGRVNFSVFIYHLVKNDETFKYSFWLRTCAYTRQSKLLKYSLYPLAKFLLSHYQFKYGISIPHETLIGDGLYIGHFGGIVVNSKSKIGKNFNISQGVTLGMANRGKNKGYPEIGDNVYIGPGAKVIGGIKIGNNVAVGANCVVTKDVPDNAVVVGVPGKVISYNGSGGYIANTSYDELDF